MFLDIPSVLPFGLCQYLAWIIAHSLGLSLCLALWILFADCRSPTHACPWIILCPVLVIPVCYCPTLPVLTMYYNKSLRVDPHVSRLVCPVTEYSAKPGSSGFSNRLWSGMDASYQLLDLRQGSLSIEEYVTQFCLLSNDVHFDEVALKDILVDRHESNQSTVDRHKSSQATSDLRESSRTTSDHHESSQATSDHHESSQATSDHHESSQATSDRHESIQTTVNLREPSLATVDLQLSSQSHSTSQLSSQSHSTSQLSSQSHSTSQLSSQSHSTPLWIIMNSPNSQLTS